MPAPGPRCTLCAHCPAPRPQDGVTALLRAVESAAESATLLALLDGGPGPNVASAVSGGGGGGGGDGDDDDDDDRVLR